MPMKRRGPAASDARPLEDGEHTARSPRLLWRNYESPRATRRKRTAGIGTHRDRYVHKHPLCEMCLKQGRYVAVEEVHHIVPLSEGGTNDESNLMSLCRSCHEKIHKERGDR